MSLLLLSAPGPFPVTPQESVNTEERIAQILKEAQTAMLSKNNDISIYSSSQQLSSANTNIQTSYGLAAVPSSTAVTPSAKVRDAYLGFSLLVVTSFLCFCCLYFFISQMSQNPQQKPQYHQ